jgi:hypothetical protein
MPYAEALYHSLAAAVCKPKLFCVTRCCDGLHGSRHATLAHEPVHTAKEGRGDGEGGLSMRARSQSCPEKPRREDVIE